jgi:hypothetical protein
MAGVRKELKMAYATYTDVQTRLGKTFTTTEKNTCTSLLDRAALMIDSFSTSAGKSDAIKKEVSVNMVSRVMAGSDLEIPVGATQGSMSGLGYAQSWTISNGSTGELYFSKDDKRLLGVGNAIGSHSPVEDMAGGGLTS